MSKRPGGDPILTIEIKRASGGAKRPHVFRRPSPSLDARSWGFEWRALFVGVTRWALNYERLGLDLEIQTLLNEWNDSLAHDDDMRQRRAAIELIRQAEHFLKHQSPNRKQIEVLQTFIHDVGQRIFGVPLEARKEFVRTTPEQKANALRNAARNSRVTFRRRSQ